MRRRRACERRLISPSFNYLLWSPGGRSKGLSVNERGIDRRERQGFCSPAPPLIASRSTSLCLLHLGRRSGGQTACLWTASKNKAAIWHQTSVQKKNCLESVRISVSRLRFRLEICNGRESYSLVALDIIKDLIMRLFVHVFLYLLPHPCPTHSQE